MRIVEIWLLLDDGRAKDVSPGVEQSELKQQEQVAVHTRDFDANALHDLVHNALGYELSIAVLSKSLQNKLKKKTLYIFTHGDVCAIWYLSESSIGQGAYLYDILEFECTRAQYEAKYLGERLENVLQQQYNKQMTEFWWILFPHFEAYFVGGNDGKFEELAHDHEYARVVVALDEEWLNGDEEQLELLYDVRPLGVMRVHGQVRYEECRVIQYAHTRVNVGDFLQIDILEKKK